MVKSRIGKNNPKNEMGQNKLGFTKGDKSEKTKLNNIIMLMKNNIY